MKLKLWALFLSLIITFDPSRTRDEESNVYLENIFDSAVFLDRSEVYRI